jgi:hypothetical protein
MSTIFWTTDQIALASFGVTALSTAGFVCAARKAPWELIAAALVAGGLLLAGPAKADDLAKALREAPLMNRAHFAAMVTVGVMQCNVDFPVGALVKALDIDDSRPNDAAALKVAENKVAKEYNRNPVAFCKKVKDSLPAEAPAPKADSIDAWREKLAIALASDFQCGTNYLAQTMADARRAGVTTADLAGDKTREMVDAMTREKETLKIGAPAFCAKQKTLLGK